MTRTARENTLITSPISDSVRLNAVPMAGSVTGTALTPTAATPVMAKMEMSDWSVTSVRYCTAPGSEGSVIDG